MNGADEISQAERRRIMADDRRAKTYFGQAQHADDDLGGRFKRVTTTTLTGSSPTSMYPAQPANSPWHQDACPPEPPLGFSVDEMELVGEVHERGPPSTTAAPDVEGVSGGPPRVVGRHFI